MTLTEAKLLLTNLELALATGEKTVKSSGREVTYRDASELADVANKLRRDISCRERRNAGGTCSTTATWSGAKA